MNEIDTKLGPIVVISDYIKGKKNKFTGELHYQQSNTPLDGYIQRYVGILLTHTGNIYVSVAVNSKNDNTNSNWWKYIIENRLSTVINNNGNIGPDDKGVTMVPMSYKEFLYKDSAAYNNIYGAIEPTVLEMALTKLKSSLSRKIKSAYNNLQASKVAK
jgi:hypothetical protein